LAILPVHHPANQDTQSGGSPVVAMIAVTGSID
jgi:hypothetical protein